MKLGVGSDRRSRLDDVVEDKRDEVVQ